MADMNPPDTKNPSQQKLCNGHKPHLPNYQNNKLVSMIECILPNGYKSWHLVAIAYKEESDKEALWTKEDV
jgi:hypothetical protein